ncbi:hypothetical protein [Mesorhizobium sp. M0843]|uniref:hypothetical protein n=1 Tax=Mesorhizobium sp. M0843 TaxID=2957010 RepID=UPI00333547EC
MEKRVMHPKGDLEDFDWWRLSPCLELHRRQVHGAVAVAIEIYFKARPMENDAVGDITDYHSHDFLSLYLSGLGKRILSELAARSAQINRTGKRILRLRPSSEPA